MNTIHLDRNNALIESYAKIESVKTFPKIQRLLQNSMNIISTM